MEREVTTYYLEITEPEAFRPVEVGDRPFTVRQAEIPYPALNRFFYHQVGRAFHWADRLVWDEEDWRAWLDRPTVQTWIGYLRGTPAGYFELEKQEGGNVEIAYFGLLPPFLGQGLGGLLLSAAVQAAWDWGASRVWVHTCSLDHPAALPNYLKRGFRIYDEKVHLQRLRPA